jgi:hypothetical protein
MPELKSPKLDCGPYTQAKLAHKLFPSTAMQTDTIGILTHIDLWGKYQIQSIHGNQYYILFVDNYSRYVMVQFLKGKNQAVQHIHDYIMHLSVRNFVPQALHIDCGTEFINDKLKQWCNGRRIEI